MATRSILVTGSTGKQGGSLINALLKANAPFEILALTRDAQSSSAQKLLKKSSSIKIVTGNLDNVEDVFVKAKAAATAPLWGVFSVQFVTKNEEKQAKAIVDASLKYGVKHIVYSSVDRGGDKSIDNPTQVPHFIAKHNAEHYLINKSKGSDLTWTILRPVAFFDNLVPGFFGKVFNTSYVSVLHPTNKPLQMIATSDIGFFAAQSFLNPDAEQYKNKGISLAGDELTYDQYKQIFEKTTGEPVALTFHFVVRILHYLIEDFGKMYQWFRDVGYGVDIEALRKVDPELKTFETWLKTESAWKKN